ncbi:hypothetical protein WJX73_003481 [Symbiochloris irregularis]|uniref:Heat shock protein 70 n=1 Tax=Symbiochloris irregularis TaxID=706552 RepID=A0AAW1PZS7_9CHLO
MSTTGFDIGDQTSCVAVARKRGIDVLLNKESKRECPSVISFGPKQRQLGTDAVGSLAISPKNAVAQLKRLLGKPFSSPDVQRDIQKVPFSVTEGPGDTVLVNVQYLNEPVSLTPEALVAMILVDLKSIADTDGSPVTDCVIGVPAYFADAERRSMLAAAQVAGVNCLRLLNETTATALAYGIYKADLPEKEALHVAFVDAGHSALQVSVVAFKKGQLQVLSHAWDRNLGGRDFDEVLFEHFVKEFDAKHKLDIKSNARASFRLRVACEKMKKVLSANAEASISVESIVNDVDVRGKLNRDDFEQMCQPLLSRVAQPLETALATAKLQAQDLASVEVVGSSSRVPALIAIIKQVLGQDPSRTMNAKECVSRGCALNCAMLSPIFRVRDFEVIDSFPFGISLSWDKDGESVSSVLFERNGPIPSTKVLTFKRTAAFQLAAAYTEDSPLPEGLGGRQEIFNVGPPKVPGPAGTDMPRLKVRLRLNLHGLVGIESVLQVEDEEYDEVIEKPVKPAAKAAPAAAAAPAPAEPADEPMPDSEAGGEMAPETPVGSGQEASSAPRTPEPVDDKNSFKSEGTQPLPTDNGNATPMETEASQATVEKEVVKRKRTHKLPVPFQAHPHGLNQEAITVMYERECEMALQGRIQEATNEAKNALEAYIYATRSKLAETWAEYATDAERSSLSERLEKMEDWLYEDGEDETKAVYNKQLEDLTKQAAPIAARAQQAESRGPAATALENAAQHYLQLVEANKPAHSHISKEDKDKVVSECNAALSWLQQKQDLQAGLRKTDDPVLLAADIKKKTETLSRVCHPLMSKPAPPPPAPAKTEAKEEAPAEAMDTDAPASAPGAGDTVPEASAAAADAAQEADGDAMRE